MLELIQKKLQIRSTRHTLQKCNRSLLASKQTNFFRLISKIRFSFSKPDNQEEALMTTLDTLRWVGKGSWNYAILSVLFPGTGCFSRGNSRTRIACVPSVSVWFRSKEIPILVEREMKRQPTCTIFRAVFDSRSSVFAPKPHGNACYAG